MSKKEKKENQRTYDLNKQESMFLARGVQVPSSEKEFIDLILNKKMRIPTKFIKDAVISTGITEDELEEDYKEREDLLALFIERFHILYVQEKKETNKDKDNEKINTDKDTKKEEWKKDKEINFSLERVQKIFEKQKKNLIDAKEDIQVNSPTIKEGMDISIHDDFEIKYKNFLIYCNAAIIVTEDRKEIIALGRIVKKSNGNKERKYFIGEKSKIDFDKFGNSSIFGLVLFSQEYAEILEKEAEITDTFSGKLWFKEISIQLEKMKQVENILCIDFGTSNTTAGTYGVKKEGKTEPELVDFIDVTNENKLVKLCPTMVYVLDCSNSQKITYLFGYEARKKVIENNYNMVADVFYEIKNWIGDTSTITLTDEKGKKCDIQKCRIVKAYIDYIIEMAQDCFKVKFMKLHFTAPVKMKSVFIRDLTRMFQEDNNYIVCKEEASIDEAVAIVYDYIYEQEIENQDDMEENEKKIVVLDCGGGTTDLATCVYTKNITRNGYKRITGRTKFENGSSIYGGNNITYKIMQLIKIKICKSYGKITEEQYNEIFDCSEKDILGAIDIELEKEEKNCIEKLEIYKKFQKLYDFCEEIIPTRFEDNRKFRMDEDKKAMKRNFYYLWQLAEMVKLDFYKKEKVQVDFEDSAKMLDIPESSNSLYICDREEDEELQEITNPTKEIRITITDIRKIICGDIYILLNHILPKNPENYDYYQLSGQSCKINLFNELLKEFIPGKKLRSKLKQSMKNENSIELKLKCIIGSINFMADKEHGKCEMDIVSDTPKLIYSVFYEDDEQGKPLFSLERKEASIIILTKQQRYIDLVIQRLSGEKVREINCNRETDREKFQKLAIGDITKKFQEETALQDIEELAQKIEDISNDETDGSNQVNLALVLPSKDGYGFIVYCLLKHFGDKSSKLSVTYSLSQGEYFDYENKEDSFFNGRR